MHTKITNIEDYLATITPSNIEIVKLDRLKIIKNEPANDNNKQYFIARHKKEITIFLCYMLCLREMELELEIADN